jgi:hypothetical protein
MADDSTEQEDIDNLPTVAGLSAGRKLFGRYVLESELGSGGMGVVWQAKDVELDEPVALKFLPEVVARDDEAIDELKDETRHARRLTHPNIVRVHQFEHAGFIAAISMELVDGMTLKKLRLEQPGKVFAVSTLAPLVGQLCAALDYAHSEANIVHRDIKPANVLVTRNDVVKVTDFGIARSLAETSTRLTGTGSGGSGTILYMSPQQIHGSKPKGTDDLYSLGAMLYELLTSKPPFFRGDLYSLRMQILNNTPVPLAVQRAQLEVQGDPIPTAWSETILACLAKKPEDRPQSAEEVARRLGITRSGIRVHPVGRIALQRGNSVRRGIALGAAAAGLFALCLMAYIYWPRSTAMTPVVPRPKTGTVEPVATGRPPSAPPETAQVNRVTPSQVSREPAPVFQEQKLAPKPPLRSPFPAASVSVAPRTAPNVAPPEVQARYDHAKELASQGDNAAALAEFLWCFDEGMRNKPQLFSLRLNGVLGDIAKLGRTYPPALQAMRERRDAAKTRVLKDNSDTSSLSDMVALNRQLREDEANYVFYDQLQPGSAGRAALARHIRDRLIEAKRYSDAAAAQTFDQFRWVFDSVMKQFDAHLGQRVGIPRFVVQSGGLELEALAGAGDVEHARELLKMLLKADSSEATITGLREHLERSGHSELLLGMTDETPDAGSPRKPVY